MSPRNMMMIAAAGLAVTSAATELPTTYIDLGLGGAVAYTGVVAAQVPLTLYADMPNRPGDQRTNPCSCRIPYKYCLITMATIPPL